MTLFDTHAHFDDAAFDAEVEEFCLALLTGTYPADFVPEDGAAESEASAE